MANAGDRFRVEVKEAHLNWGSHRHTNSRDIIEGEGYIQIPRNYAQQIGIYNSNYNDGNDILGNNIFICSSYDGFLDNIELKATGCSTAGDIYAKQFQGNGNLQTISNWYHHVNAQVGNVVEVEWISPTNIIIRLL
ncbi:MAG: hypothetical protein U0J50_01905 [Peptacetobacter hiranonis]|nr:hypothetical protein [Peptacetobacter hiranonis]